ncbi:SOS response-associated peptidase family protein [Leptospira sp. 201903074]|uniref:SOS response-associated peptidase family protein n=1 Tax=Leptospira abararensis TaxID=2810036 RepID=UPI00196311A9|nr:SOS response-associated peptidase family protein [Leptospira abararensis]MBM9546084.1 SOS response-associated peptidase family protein [Leptospira abararensis]
MSNLFTNRLVAPEEYKTQWQKLSFETNLYEEDYHKHKKDGLAVKPNDHCWYLREVEGKIFLSSGTWGTKQAFANRPITTTQSEHIFSSSFWKNYSTNRCLIPVISYFEWQMQRSGEKHKFKIEFIDKNSFFGGIWGAYPNGSTWVTIITQAANKKTAEIHNSGNNKNRQPIVIRKGNLNAWLDPKLNSESQVKKLITQFQPNEISTEDLDYEQTLFD